jgi:hypothetical protein
MRRAGRQPSWRELPAGQGRLPGRRFWPPDLLSGLLPQLPAAARATVLVCAAPGRRCRSPPADPDAPCGQPDNHRSAQIRTRAAARPARSWMGHPVAKARSPVLASGEVAGRSRYGVDPACPMPSPHPPAARYRRASATRPVPAARTRPGHGGSHPIELLRGPSRHLAVRTRPAEPGAEARHCRCPSRLRTVHRVRNPPLGLSAFAAGSRQAERSQPAGHSHSRLRDRGRDRNFRASHTPLAGQARSHLPVRSGPRRRTGARQAARSHRGGRIHLAGHNHPASHARQAVHDSCPADHGPPAGRNRRADRRGNLNRPERSRLARDRPQTAGTHPAAPLGLRNHRAARNHRAPCSHRAPGKHPAPGKHRAGRHRRAARIPPALQTGDDPGSRGA